MTLRFALALSGSLALAACAAGPPPEIATPIPALPEAYLYAPTAGDAAAIAALGDSRNGALKEAIVPNCAAFPKKESERMALLGTIFEVYKRRMDDMAQVISEEMGAPIATVAKPLQAPSGLGHFMVALGVLKQR